jgi:hypothetical protein
LRAQERALASAERDLKRKVCGRREEEEGGRGGRKRRAKGVRGKIVI